MRRAAWVLLLLALAAPATAQAPVADACLPGATMPSEPREPSSPDPDPRIVDRALFLSADGRLVDNATEGEVFGGTSIPLAGEAPVVWALDATDAGTLLGDAVLELRVHVCFPAAAAPPSNALFSTVVLVNGSPAAAQDIGPVALVPGTQSFAAPLNVDGVALAAGDSLAVQVTVHALNLDALPTLHYVVGPEGSRLDLRERYASLDALRHEHARGDQHFVLGEQPLRIGDLGRGLWGVAIPIPLTGTAGTRQVPANATRVLLQFYLPADPGRNDTPARVTLDLVGGSLTVHRGEVVTREVAAGSFDVLCASCAGQPPIASVSKAPAPDDPSGTGNTGGPGSRPGEPLTSTQQGSGLSRSGGPVRSPSGEIDAAYDDASYIFALLVPAALMLLAGIWYVVHGHAAWGATAPAQAPAPRTATAARPTFARRP